MMLRPAKTIASLVLFFLAVKMPKIAVAAQQLVGPGVGIDPEGSCDISVEQTMVQLSGTVNLAAGTYDVPSFEYFPSGDSDGTFIPFLVSSAAGTTQGSYDIVWVGDSVDSHVEGPQTMDLTGQQQFTLVSATEVFAGFYAAQMELAYLALDDESNLPGTDDYTMMPVQLPLSIGTRIDLTQFDGRWQEAFGVTIQEVQEEVLVQEEETEDDCSGIIGWLICRLDELWEWIQQLF